MLITGTIATPLADFIKRVNDIEQKNRDQAIETFCKSFESMIFTAIKKITITIPSGSIVVTGSALAQTNAAPIILNSVVK